MRRWSALGTRVSQEARRTEAPDPPGEEVGPCDEKPAGEALRSEIA